MIKWVLGSGSPRRKELLSGLGVSFEIRVKDTDESFDPTMPTDAVPEYLAAKKASALIPDLQENEMIICADTVVILDDQIIGKPTDHADAHRMLRQLSGQTHRVITGVFIGNRKIQRSFSDKSEVSFRDLSDEEIDYYITNYQPFDKAGSYGIQEWLGYVAITRMEGTYTNVMGLPTNNVFEVIRELENKN